MAGNDFVAAINVIFDSKCFDRGWVSGKARAGLSFKDP
jgi:hypothetical protein